MRKYKKYFEILIITFVVAIFTSSESPVFGFSYWPDTNCFLAVGRALKHGQAIYVDIFDHKGPLFYILLHLLSIISESNYIGYFIFEVILLYIFNIYNYKILYELRVRSSMLIIVLTTIIVTTSAYTYDLFKPELILLALFQYTIYIVLFQGEITSKQALLIGIHIGIIACIKINLILPYIFIILFNKKLIRKIAIIQFGSLLIVVVSLLYCLINNNLYAMLNIYIFDNLGYSGIQHCGINIIKFITFAITDLATTIIILAGIIFSDKYIRETMLVVYVPYILMIGLMSSIVNYYYIPLLSIVIFGIINIKKYLCKHITSSMELESVTSFMLILTIMSVIVTPNVQMWLNGGSGQNLFKHIIENSDDKSISCIYSNPNDCSVINLCNVVPTTYYFTGFNFKGDKLHDIEMYQQSILDNKKVKYIISDRKIKSDNYDIKKEALIMVPESSIAHTYSNVTNKYYLYERKE